MEAHAVLGQIALKRQQYGMAKQHCDEALKLRRNDPANSAWIQVIRCKAYLGLGQMNEAAHEFDKLQEITTY